MNVAVAFSYEKESFNFHSKSLEMNYKQCTQKTHFSSKHIQCEKEDHNTIRRYGIHVVAESKPYSNDIMNFILERFKPKEIIDIYTYTQFRYTCDDIFNTFLSLPDVTYRREGSIFYLYMPVEVITNLSRYDFIKTLMR